MRILVKEFGFPYRSYVTIHVAGTKGKGSTASFIAGALTAHGYKTGLYTSPHVMSYMERFSISGFPVDESLVIEQVDRIREKVSLLIEADRSGVFPPTTFELLTLLAFLCFREAGCSHAVFEVGLGGRLDATNVIEPVASLITPIDLEHTDILGKTMEAIAAEKAGIIKPRIPVFSGFQKKEVRSVFEKISKEREAPLFFLEDEIERMTSVTSLDGTRVSLNLKGRKQTDLGLSLLGDFQADNAALASLAINRVFPEVSDDEVKKGFLSVALPGRMEVVSTEPPIVLDGAHTPLAVQRLIESFSKLFPEKGILVFGSVTGKDFRHMAEILSPFFKTIIVSRPDTERGSDPEAVFSTFKSMTDDCILEIDPGLAVKKAMVASDGKLPILVTGSFYLVEPIRKMLIEGR
jgi:dihydrofolate synthase/folylpolyglutamate synthase